jgi:hypothetical protein
MDGMESVQQLDDTCLRWVAEIGNVGTALGFDDRQVSKDLDRFKELIESRGQESGAWRGDV